MTLALAAAPAAASSGPRIEAGPASFAGRASFLAFTSDGRFLIALFDESMDRRRASLALWDAESGRLVLRRTLHDLPFPLEHGAFAIDLEGGHLVLPGGSRAIDVRTGSLVALRPGLRLPELPRADLPPGPAPRGKNEKERPALPAAVLARVAARTVPYCGGCNRFSGQDLFAFAGPLVAYRARDDYLVLWNWQTDAVAFLSAGPDLLHLAPTTTRDAQLPGFFERPGIPVGPARVIFDGTRADVDPASGAAIVVQAGTGVIGVFDLARLRPALALPPEQWLPRFEKKHEPVRAEVLGARVLDAGRSIVAVAYRSRFRNEGEGGRPERAELMLIDHAAGAVRGRLALPHPQTSGWRLELVGERHALVALGDSGRVVDLAAMKVVSTFEGRIDQGLGALRWLERSGTLRRFDPRTGRAELVGRVAGRTPHAATASADGRWLAYTFDAGPPRPEIGIFSPRRATVLLPTAGGPERVFERAELPALLPDDRALWFAGESAVLAGLGDGREVSASAPLGRPWGELRSRKLHEDGGRRYDVVVHDGQLFVRELVDAGTLSLSPVLRADLHGDHGTRANDVIARGRFLVWVGGDYVPRFFDLEARRGHRLAVSPTADAFLLVRDDGFYAGSPELLRRFHGVDGFRTAGIEGFDAALNRPELILRGLPFHDRAVADLLERVGAARARLLGAASGFVLDAQPALHVVESRVERTDDGDVLELLVAPQDAARSPTRLRVYADGVPVFGRAGLAFAPGEGGRQRVRVPLIDGRNAIEISGERDGVESARRELVVESSYAPKDPVYLGVHLGVSRFADAGFDLEYAAKDAQDLAAKLEVQGRRKETLVRVDAQVGRSVLAELRERLERTTVHDVVILTAATHGVLTDDLGYYLAGHDMDFENPAARGIPYAALEGLLDGIPARRRVLLLDACHAGEALGAEDLPPAGPATPETKASEPVTTRGVKRPGAPAPVRVADLRALMERFFPEVRRGTGAIVVSASGAEQFALESELWRNGVFTYAWLTGLGAREGDLDRDGRWRVREVREYVQREVPRLTGGRQTPMSRLDNLRMDFVLRSAP